MATVQIHYTWSDGAALTTTLRAKVRNPEALALLRLEARKAWRESLEALNLEPVEIVDEP